jgi:hypothetical protein
MGRKWVNCGWTYCGQAPSSSIDQPGLNHKARWPHRPINCTTKDAQNLIGPAACANEPGDKGSSNKRPGDKKPSDEWFSNKRPSDKKPNHSNQKSAKPKDRKQEHWPDLAKHRLALGSPPFADSPKLDPELEKNLGQPSSRIIHKTFAALGQSFGQFFHPAERPYLAGAL